MTKECPYKDYNGVNIRDGDKMEHPNGMEFTVFYDDNRREWMADYGDGTPPANLLLQIGEKGQAVVKRFFNNKHTHTLSKLRIKIGESQSIVNHRNKYYSDAAWRCRYTKPTDQDCMAMASIYEDFDCLFNMTNRDRNAVINAVKRELAKEN